ncbi:MAG: LEA type 2 family protein [Myxococcaceae bacterium]|nr:LEA type 2 family protein [Myxococcaceae bacterium]MCI0671264.1 LEA type 2 family protein [Myxococcaceae bacterium]
MRAFVMLCLAVLSAGCLGRGVRPDRPAQLLSQELRAAEQGLTDFRLRLGGELQSPEVPATLQRAVWELVVDGQVVAKGEQPYGLALPPGATVPFALEQGARFVDSPSGLSVLTEKSGTLLAALRGELVLERAGREERLPFASSRELKVPRLPSVRLHALDGARYSAERVVMTVFLAVRNPNAFPIRLSRVTYQAAFGDKPLSEGEVARGASVDASSSAVFELQVELDPESYGPGVKQLIASQRVPYRITGKLEADLYEAPFALEGEVRLNASR